MHHHGSNERFLRRSESSCSQTPDCMLVTDSDVIAVAHAGRSKGPTVVDNKVDLARYTVITQCDHNNS